MGWVEVGAGRSKEVSPFVRPGAYAREWVVVCLNMATIPNALEESRGNRRRSYSSTFVCKASIRCRSLWARSAGDYLRLKIMIFLCVSDAAQFHPLT